MPHLFCEQTGKAANDPLFLKKRGAVTVAAAQKGEFQQQQQQPQQILAHGPIIVGAGPSGLAVAACLKEKGVPSIILERADCIASLWQRRSYDRLRLHLPKRFCELPLHPFPKEFPEYPDKNQFIAYLESYARRFHLRPRFNECVQSASYNRALRMWRVRTVATGPDASELVKEYLGKWLVVATGENAEAIEPGFPGADRFTGNIMHACSYRNGHRFRDQNVLVVGCGNSGMEMCLDLSLYNANPSVVVRDSVHVLPRSILGLSTFGIAMCLLRWLPVRFVDRMLLLAARLLLGDTSRHGLPRPAMGPLELKNRLGRTPVLDVGTWELIRAGRIKVFPAVECLTPHGARFVDGQERDFDTVILATGYRTNVLSWLQGCDEEFAGDGYPKKPFPNGWKGENGLYTVGFTRKGMLGAAMDASRIAEDVALQWKAEEARAERSHFS